MSDENTKEGWIGIGKWWWAAAIVVLVVVLGLLYVLLPVGGNNNAAPAPASSAPAPPPPSSPATTSASTGQGWADSGCFGQPGDGSQPDSAPRVNWVPVGTSSVPSSSAYGPANTAAGLRRCYQHSPSGALLAAVTIPAELGANAASPGTVAEIAKTQVAPGAGRQKLLNANRTPDSSWSETVQAYKFDACSPDRCNVDLVMSSTGSGTGNVLVQTPESLVWSGQDWTLDVSTLGGSKVSQIPAGFTTWAPGE